MKKIIVLIAGLLGPSLYAKLPQKVLICGVCKNVAARLPYTIKIMEKIGALFADYRVIIYENNSTDDTPVLLQRWQASNSRVCAISEQLSQSYLESVIINRVKNNKKVQLFVPEAIARARNIVLQHAMSDKYQGFDYVIWMDMDFNREPAYEGFIEVFSSNQEWDAVFAYGIDPHQKFWDWYALRDQDCPLGSELLGNDWWYLPKTLKLTVHDAWYPVISAFGGCGIYKKSSIKDCWYSALVTQDLGQLSAKIIKELPEHQIIKKYYADAKKLKSVMQLGPATSNLSEVTDAHIGFVIPALHSELIWRMSSFVYKYPSVCEHVPFHASMIMRGHDKLFINPRLIFRYNAD